MVQRIRIRYAKRGRLRFTSHRDFARALERAVRRAGVPIAYSAGFSPHPKISYVGAAPTGVASEAEYAEIGLSRSGSPEDVRAALDTVLPDGLDVVEAVVAGPGGLAERIEVSRWRVELPGVDPDRLQAAVAKFTAAECVPVERLTKQGRRSLDARAAVVRCEVVRHDAAHPGGPVPAGGTAGPREMSGSLSRISPPSGLGGASCAILDLVVRHVTPSVRPDEVLAGLRVVADLEPPVPVRATRLAQGTLTEHGDIVDPLAADREGDLGGRPST
ncbi:MAG TPA: TIGR03936 family radical SAM-associated protein [Micromonosporaceae bacterium]